MRGMTCGNCVAHVKNAIEDLDGVEAVSVDLEDGRALVAGSPDPQAVERAVSEAGYEAECMTCKNCAMHVEKAARGVSGVESCVVDLEDGRATVRGEEFDREAVANAIEEAGYEARPADG